MATYVDPSAATNGSGTLESPYNTWTGRSFPADGRLLQKWGTTTTTPIAPTGNGTAAARALVGVYHPDTGAVMDDVVGGAFVDATGSSYGIGLGAARTYVTVSGFHVFGGTNYGILKEATNSSEAQHNWFVNCILRDSLSVGADIRGAGNKVLNCLVYGNASDGIFARADNLEIGNSRFWNNGSVGTTGDGVQVVDSSSFYVHDCDIEHLNPSKQAFLCSVDAIPGTSGGLIVNTRMACQQHVSGTTLADQKTLQVLTPGVTVRSCTIEGGQYGAFMQGANSVIEDCLLIVTGAGSVVGIAIRAAGIAARRNTVIGNDAKSGTYGIDHSDSAYTSTTIYCNALKGWPRAIKTTTSGFTYSHNAFEDCTIRNANAAGTEGTAGTGDVVGSLGLSSSYVPAVGSAVDGVGLHLQYATDRARTMRFNPPSIGAFEPIRQREART